MSTISNVSAEKVRAILADASTPGPNRQVTISVRGQQVTVDCPPWCTHPHDETYRTLDDVSHHSDEISLTTPSYRGATEQALTARLSVWPFADDPETDHPFIAFDAVGDEYAQLTPAAFTAFADQVIAHGYALRALAAVITSGATPAPRSGVEL
ncbi:DUF6907 domain-containing protein [Streptomyces noursei]|uniref:DUF6907 domain-containing protein n=1 Tax=Streptomyces noursei TaxID=1971 RepID=UPI0035D67D3A